MGSSARGGLGNSGEPVFILTKQKIIHMTTINISNNIFNPSISIDEIGSFLYDGSDESRALNNALAKAAGLGRQIFTAPAGKTISIGSTITIPENCHFVGYGFKFDASIGYFTAINLENYAKIEGIELEGPGNSTQNDLSMGITQTGNSNIGFAPSFKEGGEVINCYIHDFANSGIEFQYCKNVKFLSNRIEHIGYVAVARVSVMGFEESGTSISDVSPGKLGNAYGITSTKLRGTELECPSCKNGYVHDVTIDGIPNWEGVDCHAGENILHERIVVRNCWKAFSIGPAVDTADNPVQACKNVGFSQCYAYDPAIRSGTVAPAFTIYGAFNVTWVDYAEDCYIRQCYAKGYGYDDGSVFVGATDFRGTRRLECDSLTIIEPIGNGVYYGGDNTDFSLSNSLIQDVNGARSTAYVATNSGNNTGAISNYKFLRRNTGLATFVGTVGLQGSGSTQISLANGRNEALTATSGTITAYNN